ncbi:MAG TPA: PadR family transcriptional regulator [Longimicrobiales bacterium]|nr:PadR family transcriptional regulator [Longimicrobiales bacterium]
MPGDELQVLQGTLDVLVLKTLSQGAQHGYAIARWIRDTTGDELRVEDRALYVSLHRMEERGWIEAEWGVSDNNRRAKYYQLTPEGRAALKAQAVTWERYAAAVFKVLRTDAA